MGKKELATPVPSSGATGQADIRRRTQIKNLKRKSLDADIKAGSGERVSRDQRSEVRGRRVVSRRHTQTYADRRRKKAEKVRR